MRYLGLALFAEGSTDHKFLRPLLRRVTEDICASRASEQVEVSDVLELHSPPEVLQEGRANRIAAAAREAAGAWNLLFIHTDGAGDPFLARHQRTRPASQLIRAELGSSGGSVVGVVPVRETEAWVMADGEALRQAFGTSLDDGALSIPSHPRLVEHILDPKAALEDAWLAARGGRSGRRRTKAAAFLQGVGERVRLARLRDVPAFQVFEADLVAALNSLGIVRP